MEYGKEEKLGGSEKEKPVGNVREAADARAALATAGASESGERVQQLRIRAEDSLREARLRLLEAGVRMEWRMRARARTVDDYVHGRPWQALGVAAGLAFLIGYVMGRR